MHCELCTMNRKLSFQYWIECQEQVFFFFTNFICDSLKTKAEIQLHNNIHEIKLYSTQVKRECCTERRNENSVLSLIVF